MATPKNTKHVVVEMTAPEKKTPASKRGKAPQAPVQTTMVAAPMVTDAEAAPTPVAPPVVVVTPVVVVSPEAKLVAGRDAQIGMEIVRRSLGKRRHQRGWAAL